MSGFEIKIDPNVLNHLGMSLYSNTPAVLTEIISNAWDADASKVEIKIDPGTSEVVIIDNGHGMSEDDINDKFLKVGYARREQGRKNSDNLGRQVMGRKGIGKLAMFSLANKIEVTSYKKGYSPQSFLVDVSKLQDHISRGVNYTAESLPCPNTPEYGTRIRLYELQKSIDKTQSYLRKRIARRFSVIGQANGFEVEINGVPITFSDRDFLNDLEFLWEFGESDESRILECKGIKEKKVISGDISYKGENYVITGYIGSVGKPSQLSKDPEVSNNSITVIANGRVFEEDILLEFGSAKVFTSYLVGEIIADFLDDNDLPDMATSSRQKLQQNDPRYPVLKGFFDRALQSIDKEWDEWRRKHGMREAQSESPALKSWLSKFKNAERLAAEKLIGKVNTFRFSGSEQEQKEAKREVLKNTVLAFEKLRINDNLKALEKIENLSSENFRTVFSSIDDIEASMFYEITSQRMKVIDIFKSITNENELERVVQEYLYKHLWLLDPSWERSTGETFIEQTLTKELMKINPDSTTGARIDIAFKTISGKHIIIEMKRPKVHPDIMSLVQQGKKYLDATTQWYRDNPKSCPGGNVPHIEIIFLLGRGYTDDDQNFLNNQLASIYGKIMTYSDLITQSHQAYQDYHNKSKEVAEIKRIIEEI